MPLFAAFGDPSSIIVDPDTGATLAQAMVGAGPLDAVGLIHGRVTRYLGVGGMLVGGLWSLFKMRELPRRAASPPASRPTSACARAARSRCPRTERDMPMNIILILIGASVIPLFFLFWHFTGSVGDQRRDGRSSW